MRKGSRVTVHKDGSGFDGMTGTIRSVDRGPSGPTAKAAGIPYLVWYLVKLDEYPAPGETPGIPTVELDNLAALLDKDTPVDPLGVSDEGCTWFRDSEVLPVLR